MFVAFHCPNGPRITLLVQCGFPYPLSAGSSTWVVCFFFFPSSRRGMLDKIHCTFENTKQILVPH